MNVLELFAGSRSIGKAAEQRKHNVYSSDIKAFPGVDYVTNIMRFDVDKVPFIPDMLWASPPCTYFSVASIMHHWYENHIPKTEEALLGVNIVKATLEIIKYFQSKNPNLIYYIENPRGKLRKLKIIQNHPRTTVYYCKYGDNRMKPTDIWSNNIFGLFNQNGWVPRVRCFASNTKCHHENAPRGSKTGTQGLKDNYERSIIPSALCIEIIKATENS